MSEEPEEWLPIPGFPGYEASSHGRIRNATPRFARGYSPTLKPWVVVRHGRSASYVTLCNGSRRKMLVHRLVALAFLGVPSEHQVCCHINHDSLDNRAANLRWGSQSENITEAWEERRARLLEDVGLLHDSGPTEGVPF